MQFRVVSVFTALAAFAVPSTASEPCNPVKQGVNTCQPNRAAPANYFIDFTKQTSIPTDWTLSDQAQLTYGPHGAEFTYAKRYDAPQLWTDFYLLFGRVDVVMQVAPGTGIISSAVLISDDLDEVDWEMSGNNFAYPNSQGAAQTNWFKQGVPGPIDPNWVAGVEQPQARFHTYSFDWTSERLIWQIDGVTTRTLRANQLNGHYPQTPCKLQIGVWAGGDKDNPLGTINWAGGVTDPGKAPFTMYVQSVRIKNYTPAAAYNYTDTSGSLKSIQILQDYTPRDPASTGLCGMARASQTQAVPAPTYTVSGTASTCYLWHVISAGDSCSSVEAKYGVTDSDFRAWNPGIDKDCYNIMTGIAYCVCGASKGTTSSGTNAGQSTTSAAQPATSTTQNTLATTPPTCPPCPCSTQGTTAPVIVPSAVTTATKSAPTVTRALCPDNNGSVYVGPCGARFAVECAADRAGGDFDNNPYLASTFDSCMNTCSDKNGCVGVSWEKGANGAKGPCYLKKSTERIVNKDITWGARLLNGCSKG